MDQDANRRIEHRRRVEAGRRESVGDDHVPALRDAQTMSQGRRGKMRVEQRHDDADPRSPNQMAA